MLSFVIWIIEIINIVMNIINASNYFNIAKDIKTSSNSISELSNSFSNMGAMCIINIIVSIIFCLAITIAYERSQSNKQAIDNISNFLESKNKKKIFEAKKEKDKVGLSNWIITTNDSTKKINIEKDDNIDNVAKKDECPICFSRINPKDKKCSNCGAKLKK